MNTQATTEPQETPQTARPLLSDELALHSLCEEMFYARRDYVKEHYHEPKMRVTFSPAGYDKVRACAEAMMRFSHHCSDAQTVNGYPFTVERDQKEDFVIHGANCEVRRG